MTLDYQTQPLDARINAWEIARESNAHRYRMYNGCTVCVCVCAHVRIRTNIYNSRRANSSGLA